MEDYQDYLHYNQVINFLNNKISQKIKQEQETTATETIIEDLEIEQYRNIISPIFLIIVMALFVSGLIVVYTRMQPWLDTTMLI